MVYEEDQFLLKRTLTKTQRLPMCFQHTPTWAQGCQYNIKAILSPPHLHNPPQHSNNTLGNSSSEKSKGSSEIVGLGDSMPTLSKTKGHLEEKKEWGHKNVMKKMFPLKHCSFVGLHRSSCSPAGKGVNAEAQTQVSESKQQSVTIQTHNLKGQKHLG